jgi:dienelactone hydrolase
MLAPLASAAAQFDYDRSAPLKARIVDRRDTVGLVREKLVFDGAPGTRIPALIAVPKNGVARHPVVILVDGIGGWKERWWQVTSWNRGRILIDSLIAAGFAVAMADAPASGERTYENDFVSAESFVRDLPRWRDMGIKNAIEMRRLMDYLSTRADIDTARIGMLGLSHGGMMTFAIAAADPRIKAAVTGVTPMKNVPDVLVPTAHAARVHVPLLMLAGTNDAWYTRDEVDRAFAMLGTADKKLVWYDVGHRLPEDYAREATRWFARVLGK